MLFLLLLSNSYTVACPTCDIVSTTVHVDVTIEFEKDHTLFNVQWEFPKKSLLSLMKHDKNKNGILDKKEQEEIKIDLDRVWKENGFYTFVKLLKKDEKIKARKSDGLTLLATKLTLKEDSLLYETKLKWDMILQEDHYIYLRHFDKNMHYSFRLSNVAINKDSDEINIKKKKYIAYIQHFPNKSKNATVKKTVEK